MRLEIFGQGGIAYPGNPIRNPSLRSNLDFIFSVGPQTGLLAANYQVILPRPSSSVCLSVVGAVSISTTVLLTLPLTQRKVFGIRDVIPRRLAAMRHDILWWTANHARPSFLLHYRNSIDMLGSCSVYLKSTSQSLSSNEHARKDDGCGGYCRKRRFDYSLHHYKL